MGDNEDYLPEHKRTGYAEKMYEQADLERRRKRDEQAERSLDENNNGSK